MCDCGRSIGTTSGAMIVVSARTHDGRTLRLLTLLDEVTRECLAIRVERRIGSPEVIETLSDVILCEGSRSLFDPTTAQRFWPGTCASDWGRSEPEHYTSNPVVPGRMGIVRVSMGS